MPGPSLNDIARHLGISKMTVSRALRDGRHVAGPLRDQILTTAETLGYRPDPEMKRLMSHLRQGRLKTSPRTLAFVWGETIAPGAGVHAWSQQLVAGARRQAAKLGFALEEFHLATRGMTARRLSGILEARGIPGFILSPLVSRSRGHVSMAWDKFCSVVIGLGYARPALHRVHHHHFLGMMTALRMLKKQGCRRIGFYCGSTINERMFRAWSASFLAHHPLTAPAELLALRKTPSRRDFLAWLEKTKPEVVIDAGHVVLDWLAALPKANRPRHVTLSWREDQPEVPGVDQQAEVLGAAAVDLLAAQYWQNARGLPSTPRTITTEGVWRPARADRHSAAAAPAGNYNEL